MTKYFVPLLEHNDNECEVWRFWIPVEGNQKALQMLQEKLEELDLKNEYELQWNNGNSEHFATEAEVDALVKFSRSGYMAYEHKCDGILNEKKIAKYVVDIDVGDDDLYKGGIGNFMKK